jgi:hypothetical protein
MPSVGGESDLVTVLFNRLGNLGLLLIASALLLGGLAGAAVVHHYDQLSSSTVASGQPDNGKGVQKPKHQRNDQKHPNKGHQKGGSANEPSGSD